MTTSVVGGHPSAQGYPAGTRCDVPSVPMAGNDADAERRDESATTNPEEKKALEGFFHRGAYAFIPLPAFSYARNERYWVGAFMPMLKEDQKGKLSTIIYGLERRHKVTDDTKMDSLLKKMIAVRLSQRLERHVRIVL